MMATMTTSGIASFNPTSARINTLHLRLTSNRQSPAASVKLSSLTHFSGLTGRRGLPGRDSHLDVDNLADADRPEDLHDDRHDRHLLAQLGRPQLGDVFRLAVEHEEEQGE